MKNKNSILCALSPFRSFVCCMLIFVYRFDSVPFDFDAVARVNANLVWDASYTLIMVLILSLSYSIFFCITIDDANEFHNNSVDNNFYQYFRWVMKIGLMFIIVLHKLIILLISIKKHWNTFIVLTNFNENLISI